MIYLDSKDIPTSVPIELAIETSKEPINFAELFSFCIKDTKVKFADYEDWKKSFISQVLRVFDYKKFNKEEVKIILSCLMFEDIAESYFERISESIINLTVLFCSSHLGDYYYRTLKDLNFKEFKNSFKEEIPVSLNDTEMKIIYTGYKLYNINHGLYINSREFTQAVFKNYKTFV